MYTQLTKVHSAEYFNIKT